MATVPHHRKRLKGVCEVISSPDLRKTRPKRALDAITMAIITIMTPHKKVLKKSKKVGEKS